MIDARTPDHVAVSPEEPSSGPARRLAVVVVVGAVALIALATAIWTDSSWILLPAGLVAACAGLFAFLGYRSQRDLDDACDEIEHDRGTR